MQAWWSGGVGILDVATRSTTFRAGLPAARPTSAVERQLVLRDVALVEVGRISIPCAAAVRQTVMPPGVGAAGAASHGGGDEKVRRDIAVSCVELIERHALFLQTSS